MGRDVLVAAAILGLATLARSQEPGGDKAESAAIQKQIDAYVAAFNHGDAEAVAELWTEDAQFITPAGRKLEGRDAIEASFAEYFKENGGAKLSIEFASLQFEDDTAVEEGTAAVTAADGSVSETQYVATYAQQDGRWLLSRVQESEPPPSHYEMLKELEWLIGDWVDQHEGASVVISCRWTKNHNFISRTFAVRVADRIELEGTQVIGWDPAEQTIRSWIFDSDGGFGVSAWTRDGDRWTIRSMQNLHDGRKASAVNTLTYVDENTFTWESEHRQVGGEVLPDIEPITVVRKHERDSEATADAKEVKP